MVRLLAVASHVERLGPQPLENLRRQLHFLETLGIESELLLDPEPLSFELKIRERNYDLVYLTPMRRPHEREEDLRLLNYHMELTRLLQLLNQPFIGQDFASQLAINDKTLCSHLSGLHPDGWLITRQRVDSEEDPEAFSDFLELEFPVLLKPNTLWAGLGIGEDSIASSLEEAISRARNIFRRFPHLGEIRAERLITGCREATISVLGNNRNLVVGVVELVSRGNQHVLHGEQEKTATVAEKNISYRPWPQDEWRSQLEKLGEELFERFAFRDVARFDVLVGNRINVIDINDMPYLGNAFRTDWADRYDVHAEHLLALVLAMFCLRNPLDLPQKFWMAIPDAFRFKQSRTGN
jgi:D-alanine-D-alanine ligase-like ATP-grasp enzyme